MSTEQKKTIIQFDNAVRRYREIILEEMKEAGITCWLAGGALRDYFSGVPIKTDHDMFFPNAEQFEKAKAYFATKLAVVEWESNNGMKVIYNGRVYDLIKKYFPTPVDTIENFDFTVCMIAVDYDHLYHGDTTFIDLAKRQLMVHNLNYPPSTLKRAFRYYEKGFLMCAEEMMKLCVAIQNMPKPEAVEGEEQSTNAPPSGDGGTRRYFRGID